MNIKTTKENTLAFAGFDEYRAPNLHRLGIRAKVQNADKSSGVILRIKVVFCVPRKIYLKGYLSHQIQVNPKLLYHNPLSS